MNRMKIKIFSPLLLQKKFRESRISIHYELLQNKILLFFDALHGHKLVVVHFLILIQLRLQFSERCAGTHILPKILPFLDCVVFVFVNFHFDLFGTAGIFHL